MAGGPAAATRSPCQFYLLDLDAGAAGVDTLYMADDAAGTGGIQKICRKSGIWEAKGNVPGSGEVTGVRGLTTVANSVAVTLSARTSIRLVTLADNSGFNGALAGSFSVLAGVAANTGLRGIDFAPTAALPASPCAVDFRQRRNFGRFVAFVVCWLDSSAERCAVHRPVDARHRSGG